MCWKMPTGFITASVQPRAPRGAYPLENALGHGDEIGLDVEVLEAEPFARPAEAADHLVEDEEDAVAGADVADDGPVLLGGRVGPEGLLDGLADHGRDLFGVLELDDPLDVAGAEEVAGRVGEVEGAAVAVGRLDETVRAPGAPSSAAWEGRCRGGRGRRPWPRDRRPVGRSPCTVSSPLGSTGGAWPV